MWSKHRGLPPPFHFCLGWWPFLGRLLVLKELIPAPLTPEKAWHNPAVAVPQSRCLASCVRKSPTLGFLTRDAPQHCPYRKPLTNPFLPSMLLKSSTLSWASAASLTESSFIVSFSSRNFFRKPLLNSADSIGHSRQSVEPNSKISKNLRTLCTRRRFHFCRVQRGQDRDRRRVGLPTCTALRWTLLPATNELCNNLAC